MQNYQITEKEGNSDKECVLQASVEKCFMGGIENEHEKKESVTVRNCRPVRSGFKIAAAGLAGVLLAGNSTVAVSASQGTDSLTPYVSGNNNIAGEASAAGQRKIWWGKDERDQDGEGSDGQSSIAQSVLDWDEEEILERWELDPDDFPSENEPLQPEIPDEYIPYFREMTSEAVSWYAGGKPPAADLSKYSARADAIRKEAAVKSSESLYKELNLFLDFSREFASSAGTQTGQDLVSALQDDQYSRDVRTHSLASGGNFFGRSGDDSSLMTAGKPVNDRTDGSSSVSWFLKEKNGQEGMEEYTAGADESSEVKESGDNESVRGRETVDGEGGTPSSAAPFSAKNRKVTAPAFRYLLPPSFGCDTAPGGNLTYGMNPLPVPFGVYPYTGSYTTAADLAEETQADDSEQKEGNGFAYSGDGSPLTDEDDNRSDRSEQHEYSEISGLSGDDRDRPDHFIPFRNYRGGDESGDFYGRRRIIFIGDSRTVGMEMSCGGKPEEYWSAEVSMGYNWMVNSGVPSVENLIGRNTDVVILMGVNDLGNVYRYVDYINTKAAEWKELGARTFFVSVTPVDDKKSPNAKNSRIESFNAYALENFQDVYYIDAYNRIRNSYGSPDGIHYDSATYREIYRIIEFSLYQGWYEQDGLWFYFDCGRPLTGWQYLDGQWQYMDGYGVRWIRDGRVGDRICLPLPDSRMTGDDVLCPVF